VRERATRLAERLRTEGVPAEVLRTESAVGGGGAPGVTLPSTAVGLPARYGPLLRTGVVPVVGRLERGRCLLDLRTIRAEEEQSVLESVLAARRSHTGGASGGNVDGRDGRDGRDGGDDHGSERPCR
jgi:L-seryl-tRNA(Ser) seleniumtransferase